VGPRRPFGKDAHFFDYDYDSDDDWEEEEQVRTQIAKLAPSRKM
jgi:hypothetical protein